MKQIVKWLENRIFPSFKPIPILINDSQHAIMNCQQFLPKGHRNYLESKREFDDSHVFDYLGILVSLIRSVIYSWVW